MLLSAEFLGLKQQSKKRKQLKHFGNIVKDLYLIVLLEESYGNRDKACSLVRDLLKQFESSRFETFHTIAESISVNAGWPVDDDLDDQFEEKFGKPIMDIDCDNTAEWHWAMRHLLPELDGI